MSFALYKEAEANVLYGVKVEGECTVSTDNVTICTSMGLLILESCLYKVTRSLLASSNPANVMIQINGVTNTVEITRRLIRAFKGNAYLNYANLIYGIRNNRFLNKLLRSKKFYTIQRTFVPVFVDYRYVYNPLSDTDLHVEDTLLYKTAVRHGRYVEFEEKLAGYLLTHREICESFGMKHFVRFTPNFCYKLFVGMLNPNLTDFPSKLSRVMVAQNTSVADYGLKKSYTVPEYLEIKDKYMKFINSTGGESGAIEKTKESVALLNRYIEIDSLYEQCMLAYDNLTSIGPVGLDTPAEKTLPKIYAYMSEAELKM